MKPLNGRCSRSCRCCGLWRGSAHRSRTDAWTALRCQRRLKSVKSDCDARSRGRRRDSAQRHSSMSPYSLHRTRPVCRGTLPRRMRSRRRKAGCRHHTRMSRWAVRQPSTHADAVRRPALGQCHECCRDKQQKTDDTINSSPIVLWLMQTPVADALAQDHKSHHEESR